MSGVSFHSGSLASDAYSSGEIDLVHVLARHHENPLVSSSQSALTTVALTTAPERAVSSNASPGFGMAGTEMTFLNLTAL